MRSPGTSALVYLDPFSLHSCHLNFLALGLPFTRAPYAPGTKLRNLLHLPLGFSEIPHSSSFIKATSLIERLIASVYGLGSNPVTGVNLSSHIEPLRALELFWDCDFLS